MANTKRGGAMPATQFVSTNDPKKVAPNSDANILSIMSTSESAPATSIAHTHIVCDLTHYRDRLREIHQTFGRYSERSGAAFAKITDVLECLAISYFGEQNEIGQLLMEIDAAFLDCQIGRMPTPTSTTIEIENEVTQ